MVRKGGVLREKKKLRGRNKLFPARGGSMGGGGGEGPGTPADVHGISDEDNMKPSTCGWISQRRVSEGKLIGRKSMRRQSNSNIEERGRVEEGSFPESLREGGKVGHELRAKPPQRTRRYFGLEPEEKRKGHELPRQEQPNAREMRTIFPAGSNALPARISHNDGGEKRKGRALRGGKKRPAAPMFSKKR